MKTVITFLEKELLVKIKNNELKESITKWLKEIETSDDNDAKRFLICLGIDLKTGLLKKESILQILTQIDFLNTELNYLREFDLIIARDGGKQYTNSMCHDKEFAKDKYAVIVYWSKILKKYIEKKSKGLVPVSRSEEDKIYHDFFFEKTKSLSNINEWAGWKGLVWVLPYNDLRNDLVLPQDKESIINLIIDKTGLNPPSTSPSRLLENDELLYILYPDDFHVMCYQPTVLSGCWVDTNGLYLSYKRDDGYGRTYSTSGGKYSNKERVHTWSDLNHSLFALVSIGYPNGNLKKDLSDQIILEGLNRFSKC